MSTTTARGLGWERDMPDFRDYSISTQPAKKLLRQLKRPEGTKRPPAADLREFFLPPYDQEHLNTSAVHACASLVEYFERRAHGRTVRPSRLFLYRVVRRMLGSNGDVGSDLRTTLKAIRRIGVPPERFWPYEVDRFDEDPDAFVFSVTSDYSPLVYLRLDDRNADGKATLGVVKSFLEAGFPSVFGFSLPAGGLSEANVPYRPTFDEVCGGQAVIAVGYDDRRIAATRGALLFRNSWGADWGEQGYGWLPYAFIEEQLAVDFWTLLKPDWLKSGEFRRPRPVPAK